MEIKFNWKNFKTDKPKINSLVIFQNTNNILHNNEYILAKYYGPEYDGYGRTDGKPVYVFVGGRINTKKLKIHTKLAWQIYPPSDHIGNFDSYDFKWDYYEWKEI